MHSYIYVFSWLKIQICSFLCFFHHCCETLNLSISTKNYTCPTCFIFVLYAYYIVSFQFLHDCLYICSHQCFFDLYEVQVYNNDNNNNIIGVFLSGAKNVQICMYTRTVVVLSVYICLYDVKVILLLLIK